MITGRATWKLSQPASTSVRSRALSLGRAAGRLGSAVLAAVLLLACGCRHSPEPFYPLGIYGARGTNDLQTIRNAGFNLVAGRAEKGYLDSAGQVGLKVLATPGASAGPKFSEDRAREVVSQFDSHPALWAWYLIDEPDLNGVSPGDVQRAQRFVKSLAARKPTALVLYQGGEALHYGDIADITMIDRYPIPWLPLANFPQHVRLARLGVPRDKPLIAVIQAFDWRYYPKLLPGQDNLRPPTHEELRCMAYAALTRGVTGLFFYCFDDGKWKLQEHPEVWEAVQKVVAEVNERLPLFQAAHVWWPFVHEFPDHEDAGFNAALESSVNPALVDVPAGNAAVPPGKYLIAVNNTDRPLTYRITLPRLESNRAPVFGESRELTVADDWLEDQFAPFEVHIYGPLR